MSMPPVVHVNPFVGPRAFQKGEKLFGRNRELRELTNLLIAERIVLLYSPSGAGKTSLIQAGLIPALEQEGFEVLPVIRVNVDPRTATERPDLAPSVNRFVFSTLISLAGKSGADLVGMDLPAYLDQISRAGDDAKSEVLVFDQFEEILTTDPTDPAAKKIFFSQLGAVLRNRSRSAIFSMREDYLAGLDPFLHLIPTRLSTTFRLDLLSQATALDAIIKPTDNSGLVFTKPAAEKLVDDLRTIQVQQPDGRVEPRLGLYVEPVQLQVVCSGLWEKLAPTATEIIPADIEKVGDVDEALGTYYAAKVKEVAEKNRASEREIREWFDRRLITAQNIRTQVLQEPARTQGLEDRLVSDLVNVHLVRKEDRGGRTWFELAHDRFIKPVRASNTAWFQANLSPLQRAAQLWEDQGRADDYLLVGKELDKAQAWARTHAAELTETEQKFLAAANKVRRTRRLVQALGIGVTGIMLLALAAFVVALIALKTANEQRVLAKARALAESATLQLRNDPQRGLVLAIEAGKASSDKAVEQTLRDALLESRVRAVLMHTTAVNRAIYSPDGKQILTATDVGLYLWSVATEREESFSTYLSPVNMAVFSPDGLQVLTASRDRTARLWDVKTGKELRVLQHTSPVNLAAFSPDAKQVVTIDNTGRGMLWDLTSERTPITLSDPVQSVTFSQDGKWLVNAGCAAPRRVWDVTDGQLAAPAAAPIPVMSTAFSPGGEQIVTVNGDDTVSICDAVTGKPQKLLVGHNGPVLSAEFSPDGSQIVTASEDRTARIWDANTARELTALRGSLNQVLSASFSPDGRQVVTASDQTARIWEATGGELAVLRGHSDQVNGATFSADSRRVVTVSDDNTARVWDTTTGIALRALRENSIVSAAFSPDGRQLLTASNNQAHIWNLDTGQPVITLTTTSGIVAYSKDGKQIVSAGCATRDLNNMPLPTMRRVWDLATATELPFSREPAIPVLNAAFSLDGKRLVASQGGSASICAADLGNEEVKLGGALNSVLGASFSPVDNRVVTAHGQITPLDQMARIWNPDQPSQPPIEFSGHTDWVINAAFSPDGKQIVTASRDLTARIWDTATGQERSILRGHTGWVLSATFSPDGKYIVTTSRDGTARVYLARLDDLLAFAPSRVKRSLTCEERRDYLEENIVCGAAATLIAQHKPTPPPNESPNPILTRIAPRPSPAAQTGSPGPLTPRVLVLVIDPIIDPATGMRLSQSKYAQGWSDVDELIKSYIADLQETSGGLVKYNVIGRQDVDHFPVLESGQQYDAATYLAMLESPASSQRDMMNYSALLDSYNLLQRVEKNQFDEVWIFGPPLYGLYDTRMVGQKAFFLNGPPIEAPRRRFVIMGFSYQRGVGEMLESFGHRTEFALARVFGMEEFLTWAYGGGTNSGQYDSVKLASTNLFARFILYDKIAPGHANVGLMHRAPNSTRDYDWSNPDKVPSAADDWLQFPNLPDPPNYRSMNATNWGGGDIRLHHKWWLAHLPKAVGTTNGIDNNWWKYTVDPNSAP